VFPSGATVPDVVGLPRYEAELRIGLVRLVLTVVDQGNPVAPVVAQDPAAGTSVPFGEGMTIWLGGDDGPDGGDSEPRQPIPDPLFLSGEASDD
jgi:hypothetical protein